MDEIVLPETDEQLLDECDVEAFRASGPGGQHVNTTNSAVRLRHRPSGIVITSQQERSQHRNKAICLERLRAKVAKLNYKPAKRIRTRVPQSAKLKNLEAKIERSEKKRLRAKPRVDDEH
jgi:protein subunit release factor B